MNYLRQRHDGQKHTGSKQNKTEIYELPKTKARGKSILDKSRMRLKPNELPKTKACDKIILDKSRKRQKPNELLKTKAFDKSILNKIRMARSLMN